MPRLIPSAGFESEETEMHRRDEAEAAALSGRSIDGDVSNFDDDPVVAERVREMRNNPSFLEYLLGGFRRRKEGK